MEKATTLISPEQTKALEDVLFLLIKELGNIPDFAPESRPALERLLDVVKHNVAGGKKFRAIMAILTFQHFLKQKSSSQEKLNGNWKEQVMSKEDEKLIFILASCLEILQGSILIVDDIVDRSVTRRGNLCWHLVRENDNQENSSSGESSPKIVNLNAIVDILQLESAASLLLAQHFQGKDYAAKLQILFHKCLFKTTHGKILEMQTRGYGKLKDFNMKLYEEIAKFKTSVYTFLTPIMAAVIMAGGVEEKVQMQLEHFSYTVGHFYQVRDDMEDWTRNEEVAGSRGTDIPNGRCTWCIVMTLEICTQEQRKILQENYGVESEESINKVVDIYKAVGLEQLFKVCEERTYNLLKTQIREMSPILPKDFFTAVVQKVLGRTD